MIYGVISLFTTFLFFFMRQDIAVQIWHSLYRRFSGGFIPPTVGLRLCAAGFSDICRFAEPKI